MHGANDAPRVASSAVRHSILPVPPCPHTGKYSHPLSSFCWGTHRRLEPREVCGLRQERAAATGLSHLPSASKGSSFRLRFMRTIAYGCGGAECGGSISMVAMPGVERWKEGGWWRVDKPCISLELVWLPGGLSSVRTTTSPRGAQNDAVIM